MAKSMKNPNGFGSCYKAKGKREKPWIARKTVAWEVADDGKVKQVKKTIGYFKTKGEGLKALASYSYNKHEDMTVQQLYNEWSEQHFKKLKQGSIQGIKSLWNAHISKISNYKINELKTKDYQEFYDSIETSTKTSKNVMSVLSSMLKHAVRFEYVEKNYIEYIVYKKHVKTYNREIFTDEELSMLWDNIGTKYVDTIIVMIYTGLRIRELLNLKWEDVNLDKRYLIVTESKTQAGRNRLVPLIENVTRLLRSRDNTTEYVFTSLRGKQIHYQTYRLDFMRIMEQLGMSHRVHDCRHTFASLMVDASADKTALTKIIGHTDYALTEKVYVKTNLNTLLKEVDKLVATN